MNNDTNEVVGPTLIVDGRYDAQSTSLGRVIAALVRRNRTRQQQSIADLARASGTDEAWLVGVEAGLYQVGEQDKLRRVQAALGVSIPEEPTNKAEHQRTGGTHAHNPRRTP